MKSTPLFSSPSYIKDFILYLATLESTIGMILVQEDETLQEIFIYHLSQDLVDVELSYAHVEELDLVAVHASQWN